MASDPVSLNDPLVQPAEEAGSAQKGLVSRTIESTMQTAAALDDKYKVTDTVKGTAAAIDEKYKVTDKVKDTAMAGVKLAQDVDERLQVTTKVQAAAKMGAETVQTAAVGAAVAVHSVSKMGADTVETVKTSAQSAAKMGKDTVESTKARVVETAQNAAKSGVETVQQAAKRGVETVQQLDEKFQVTSNIKAADEKYQVTETAKTTYGSMRDLTLSAYDGVKQRDPTGKIQVVEDMITPYAAGLLSKVTNLANTALTLWGIWMEFMTGERHLGKIATQTSACSSPKPAVKFFVKL